MSCILFSTVPYDGQLDRRNNTFNYTVFPITNHKKNILGRMLGGKDDYQYEDFKLLATVFQEPLI